MKQTGDGIMAIFDGAARAVECAAAIERRVKTIGLQIRAGLHTGEVELVPEDVRGVAVHVASRIMSEARSRRGAGIRPSPASCWLARTSHSSRAGCIGSRGSMASASSALSTPGDALG